MMPCPSVVRSSRVPTSASVRPFVRPSFLPSTGGVGGDVLLKIYDLAKPSEANGDVVGYLLLSGLISAGFGKAI